VTDVGQERDEMNAYGSRNTGVETVDAVTEAEVLEERAEEAAKPLGLWADTWRRLRRNRLALVGLGIIIVFLTVGTLETIFYYGHYYVRASDEIKTAVEQAEKKEAAGQEDVITPPGYLAPFDPNMVNSALTPEGVG